MASLNSTTIPVAAVWNELTSQKSWTSCEAGVKVQGLVCLYGLLQLREQLHKSKMSSLMPDCTLKCRSLQHALDIVSVVTRGSEGQIKAFLTSHCYNAATIKDVFGRNALHLASSCGKKGVLEWLAETNGVDLLVKDKESGWTALHRSVFYGYIDCAWSLLKVNAAVTMLVKYVLCSMSWETKDWSRYDERSLTECSNTLLDF